MTSPHAKDFPCTFNQGKIVAMRASTLLTLPLVAFIVESIIGLTVGFATKYSRIRLLVFAFLITYICVAMYHFRSHVPSSCSPGAMSGWGLVLPLLRYFDVLLLRPWAIEDRETMLSPRPKEKGNEDRRKPASPHHNTIESIMSRFIFGQKVMSSARGVGTCFEIERIPRFSETNSTYPPVPQALLHRKVLR